MPRLLRKTGQCITNALDSRQKLLFLLLAQTACIVVLTTTNLANTPVLQSEANQTSQYSSELKVYVIQTPDYHQDASPQHRYGFAQLGDILDATTSLWTSFLEGVPSYERQDCWWINQMNLSPLQVHDPDSADIIFIAARFDTRRGKINEEIQSFMETANVTFPFLGQKPHVIALNNPFPIYTGYAPSLISMPHSSQFTFISIEAYSPPSGPSSANWITAPYMAHVHWHQGMPKQPPFEASRVKAMKKRLACMSGARFLDHMTNKGAMREACIANEEQCKYVQWEGERESAVEVFEAMRSSWFTLMPKGDFVTRNSMYDAIMAGSIPVVTIPDITDYMPYSDVLDWNSGMLQLPKNVIAGIEVCRVSGDEDSCSESGAPTDDDNTTRNSENNSVMRHGASQSDEGTIRHLKENSGRPLDKTPKTQVQPEPVGQHRNRLQSDQTARKGDLITWLTETWDEAQTLAKQKFLHEHMHVMQYAINPRHELIRFDKMFLEHVDDDAFTFTWKAVLRNLCQRKVLPAQRCSPLAVSLQ